MSEKSFYKFLRKNPEAVTYFRALELNEEQAFNKYQETAESINISKLEHGLFLMIAPLTFMSVICVQALVIGKKTSLTRAFNYLIKPKETIATIRMIYAVDHFDKKRENPIPFYK